ncbi:hypothetical protein EVA_06241 [gut metagenome]|uniref:Uncharacterized protein n=1 Tax=gut metagenome TaxID=749906 RepID=J9GFE6_9ZZZZ
MFGWFENIFIFVSLNFKQKIRKNYESDICTYVAERYYYSTIHGWRK